MKPAHGRLATPHSHFYPLRTRGQIAIFNMGFFSKNDDAIVEKGSPSSGTPADTPARRNSDPIDEPTGRVPVLAVLLGAIASIGGFMFGYESGQISGAFLPRKLLPS